MTIKEKLTTSSLNKYVKELPQQDIYDTELKGYHARPGKKGLTLRVFYRNSINKQKVYTIGAYGVCTSAEGRAEAKRILALVAQNIDPNAEIEIEKQNKLDEESQTLKSYLDGPYTRHQKRKKSGGQTLNTIKKHFVSWYSQPMSKLKRSDVEVWQTDMEANNKAFATIQRTYGAIQTLLNHAAEKEVIKLNPIKAVRLEKPAMTEAELNTSGTSRRYLDNEEITALFKGIDLYQENKRQQRDNSRSHGKPHLLDLNSVKFVDHVKPFVMTMFYTGFRQGDLYGLRWEHVDLKLNTITKTIEKTAHHNPEARSFPIGKSPKKVLNDWWKQNSSPKSGYVFPGKTGKRMSSTALQKPWAKIRELAKLSGGLDMYTLRHNFASQLIMGGADLLTVSMLMAHKDIQTTIQHYGHLKPDHARKYIDQYCDSFLYHE